MAAPANIPDDCIVDNIQVTGQISKGKNASILEAKWEGLIVAVKDIHCRIFDQIAGEQESRQEFQKLQEHFLTECKLNHRIRHPNIVGFLGVHFTSGINLPYIVMERLHCDLNDLLEQHPIIPLEIKLRILHGIGLGLRYLHSRDPPIIHKDLTSKNVLLSEGIEVKISCPCTARLVPSNQYVQPSDFLPRMDDFIKEIGKEDDIFSFGCITIHMLSHQWPTPSQALVISNDPDEQQGIADSSSELDRRIQYIDKIAETVEEVVVPLITSCLENRAVDRPTAEEVCDQLETLVFNRASTLPGNMLKAQLALQNSQQQVESQAAELQRVRAKLLDKNTKLEKEMEVLRLEMSKLQVLSNHPASNLQVLYK